MKRIKAIRVEHFMGIEDALIEPGHVTIIQGENGSGKSSTLDAFMAAFFPKGLKREPVKVGSNEARVMVKLDDGTLITRKFKGGKSDVSVKTADGDNKGAPQSFLDGLTGGGLNFNPVEFLAKKPAEQRELLLQALPIVVTQENLLDWFERAFDVDTDKHGLEVLDEVGKQLYDERKDANANVKALQSQLDTMRSQVPMEFKAEEWEGVDTAGLTQQLQDIGRIEAEKRALYEQATEKRLNAQKSRVAATESEHKIASIQKDIEQLKKQIEAYDSLIVDETEEKGMQLSYASDLEEEAATKDKEADAMIVPDKADIEAKLSAYSEAQGILRILETVGASECKLTTAEAEAKQLDTLLELARQKPAELLKQADFPVAGLEVTDDAITFNGLPVQSLSTSEKVMMSLQIARALAKELGFILVDGIECLDPEHLLEFLEQCEADDYDYLITRAVSGKMEVTTDVEKVKKQIKQESVGTLFEGDDDAAD